MKYCVLIVDGAAGRPLPERGGLTSLELAHTPNLDAIAKESLGGLCRTVPPGMEPGSACACMSVLGYDPVVYYRGRSAIEARSLGIPVAGDEVTFRCNLVAIEDGRMRDYSAGHISSEEAAELVSALQTELGGGGVDFYPGTSYRHICKIKGYPGVLKADCSLPHDIPGKPIAGYLPKGPGSEVLRSLMERSQDVLRGHPVNQRRQAQGKAPATMIWLFWASAQVPRMPSFREVYGLKAAISSGVDLLKGLGKMMALDILDIPGVTDNLDNDYAAQAEGALEALKDYDLVVIHVEAPDEAAHAGLIDDKVTAIQRVDSDIVGRIRDWGGDSLRVLVMPDHLTPIAIRTHSPEPVPFLLWGAGFKPNGAARFTEAEAAKTGLFLDPGYSIMSQLVEVKS